VGGGGGGGWGGGGGGVWGGGVGVGVGCGGGGGLDIKGGVFQGLQTSAANGLSLVVKNHVGRHLCTRRDKKVCKIQQDGKCQET